MLPSPQPIVEAFNTWVAQYSPAAKADHICFKCESSTEFEHLRASLENHSAYMHQAIIAGRRIAIIKFLQPITTALGDIWFLELSDQKPDGSQKSGFEHIEIYPSTGTMHELARDLESKGMQLQIIERPHHTTIDGTLPGGFLIRLEPEALVEKIKTNEM